MKHTILTLFSSLQLHDLVLLCAMLFLMLLLIFFAGRFVGKLESKDEIKKNRLDAIKRSRAVLGGLAGEQVAPFLPGFPCNPADVRFVGKPVDFVAFPGAAENESISEILLIEVKTGESTLTKREREIRALVEQGRVRFVTYNLSSAEVFPDK